MSGTWVVILFAIGFIALFVLGMSLTLIFKGHNIKSEIGDNEHMKARGIKCTAQSVNSDQLTVDNGQSVNSCRAADDNCHSPTGCHSCNINTESN